MVTVENDRQSGRIGQLPEIPVYLFFRFRTEVSGIFHERVAATDFFGMNEKFQSILELGQDRIRSDVEYEVNLKAEMEVANLHEKFDRLTAGVLARLERIERGPAIAPEKATRGAP